LTWLNFEGYNAVNQGINHSNTLLKTTLDFSNILSIHKADQTAHKVASGHAKLRYQLLLSNSLNLILITFCLFSILFPSTRAEKEESQLMNNGAQKQQQQSQLRQHLDPKKAFPNRTSYVRQQQQQQPPTNITYLQNNNNNINNNNKKKSLVVNGNGHSSVITSISREKFEQRNRLHL
jgi:large-conductance mechanosensitive channel